MSKLDKIYLNHMIAASVACSVSPREAMIKFNHKLTESLSYYVDTHKIQEGSAMMRYIREEFIPLAKQYAKSQTKNIITI